MSAFFKVKKKMLKDHMFERRIDLADTGYLLQGDSKYTLSLSFSDRKKKKINICFKGQILLSLI